MMGRQTGDQSQLFYLFNLERRIPAGHLLRRINPIVTQILGELRLRQPVAFYPQEGTGRGVQAELILFYRFTENVTFGVGGRYWAMWTTSASLSCHGCCDLPDVATSIPPSPFTANTQRYGMFAQLDYQFYSYR